MRTGVKNPQTAQSAPVADVQPTKQATPTTSIPFKDLPKKSLPKFSIADTPQTYIVSISGEWSDKTAYVEWIYDARHPMLALGEAMVKFSNDYLLYSIKHWSVAAPYVKQPRNKNKQTK